MINGDIIIEEEIKVCPICLDSNGVLIQTGCKKCKGNNSIIHSNCLNTLRNNNFHITKCYICKSKLDNITIKRKYVNCTYPKLFILFIFLIFCFGFVGKLFIYFIYMIFAGNPRKFINDTINPFENIYNFLMHILIGSGILYVRVKLYQIGNTN